MDLVKSFHMFFNVFEKAIAEQFERMNFDCSVDATRSNQIGRYINDSARMFANSAMKKIVVNGIPRLCLFAKKDIEQDCEIRYDYREPSSVLPWRKEVSTRTEESCSIFCFLHSDVLTF